MAGLTMTERETHVQWCKERAREYLNRNDLPNAVASMISDMSKRDDTRMPSALAVLGTIELMSRDHEKVRPLD